MNDELMIFLVIFVTLVASVCIGLLAPFRQPFSKVDPKYFKRKKVRFLSFLFSGIGGRKSETGNVKTYGIILPMYVLHILGYVLTLALWIAMPLLYNPGGIDLDILVVVPVAVALFQTLAVVITESVCYAITRKKHREESVDE